MWVGLNMPTHWKLNRGPLEARGMTLYKAQAHQGPGAGPGFAVMLPVGNCLGSGESSRGQYFYLRLAGYSIQLISLLSLRARARADWVLSLRL